MSNVEDSGFRVQGSGFRSLDSRPSTLDSRHSRRGLSLLEVLVSIFVLAVGLLSVLTIIPLGQFALSESAKSDYSGMCGRAALREIKVHGMLDYRYWYWYPGAWGVGYDASGSLRLIPDVLYNVQNCRDANNVPTDDFMPFLIDPLGYFLDSAENMPFQISNKNATFKSPSSPINLEFVLARRTLYLPPNSLFPYNLPQPLSNTVRPVLPNTSAFRASLEKLFACPDDLAFEVPENSGERPTVAGAGLTNEGNYTWFFTVSPSSSELNLPVGQRTSYTVSAAVCFKRNFGTEVIGTTKLPVGERTVRLKPVQLISGQPPACFPGMGIGGGAMVLENNVDSYDRPLNIQNKGWVLLVRRDANGYPRKCSWYRVVNQAMDIDSTSTTGPTVTLAGPDWDTNVPDPTGHPDILIVIDGVIGVYTTTVNLSGN
ncbi:MAG: prepilin-type N-terminal cleavage/methylation domain-containing protein [Pirellulales bacterium]|nr:prepilin-type N-terminal cleavage/methylation domain-containing protein [Pirellulales bacterium]